MLHNGVTLIRRVADAKIMSEPDPATLADRL